MQKDYIVDTNVLIDNPEALLILRNGKENNVYVPNHVLAELDNLKKDKNLGTYANLAIKKIEENQDWLIFIQNSNSYSSYTDNVDQLILEEIYSNQKLKESGILVTSDRLMRLKANSYSINTNDFHDSVPYLSESEQYTGFFDNNVDKPIINNFTWVKGIPHFFNSKRELIPINFEHNVWGIKPKNVYQNLAIDLLINPNLDIVTIQSQAGHGKTFIALAAALTLALEKRYEKFNKIIITKASYEFGQKLGYLPGGLDEKFEPLIRPIVDLIYKLDKIRPANKIFKNNIKKDEFRKDKLEMLPLSYIQGMTIENSILIIDEAQNLSRKEIRGIATRCGHNTKLFAIGDTRQVISDQNEYNNGLNWIVKLCQGQHNYGHIVLKGKYSRGPITDTILNVGL